MSSSFKRLQAEKLAADKLLQELTPLQTIQDVEGLKEYIKNINLQSEVRGHTIPLLERAHLITSQMSHDEIKRLNNKLARAFPPSVMYPCATNRDRFPLLRVQVKKSVSRNSATPIVWNPNLNPNKSSAFTNNPKRRKLFSRRRTPLKRPTKSPLRNSNQTLGT